MTVDAALRHLCQVPGHRERPFELSRDEHTDLDGECQPMRVPAVTPCWGHHNQVASYVDIGKWEAKQPSERPLNHLPSPAIIPARLLNRSRCAIFVLKILKKDRIGKTQWNQ